jgi:hypothetical protein
VRGGTGGIAIVLVCMLLGFSSNGVSDQTRFPRRTGMGGLSSVVVSILTGYEYVAFVVLFRLNPMPRAEAVCVLQEGTSTANCVGENGAELGRWWRMFACGVVGMEIYKRITQGETKKLYNVFIRKMDVSTSLSSGVSPPVVLRHYSRWH